MMAAKTQAHIAWMIRVNLPAILRIEKECFPSEAWVEEDFIRCLRQRNCIGMVATVSDEVVGYMIYELHKNRLHLLNIAVDQAFHRHGIGTQMIDKLKSKLSHERRNRIMLEVTDANLPAQLFFRANGLKAISITTDFFECKDGSTQDAFLFQYRHTTTEDELQTVDRCQTFKG